MQAHYSSVFIIVFALLIAPSCWVTSYCMAVNFFLSTASSGLEYLGLSADFIVRVDALGLSPQVLFRN